MRSLYVIVAGVFFLSASTVNAQSFDYLPAPVGSNQIIEYTQFTLSYNNTHEQADWVAYELTKAEAEMSRTRCNCFEEDEDITYGSAVDDDYGNTGFDRGHLAPARDNNMSDLANEESFLFSNMSPMVPSFNQEIWESLEEWVNDKAEEYGTLYVVTGPVFVNNLGSIGSNDVTIPGYFFKAVMRFDENDNPQMMGFIIPNLGWTGIFSDYTVPINTIETLTGLDLFPALVDSKEGRYEASEYTRQWGL